MFPILLLLLVPQLLFANTIDSLLADNRLRAGVRADDLFAPLDKPNMAVLDANKLEDYRFLLANLPLSDLALMTAEDITENVHLARQAKESFSWGSRYSQDFFRSFVLPHRVSQEPFVHWRKQFLDEIGPRVKNLSMADAILEVNHWCHEKATYRPTDGRDQDPLTTIRSGFGRCEEEMILTICALRSVGIPARQCYTPYWAHSDDNHAWVEAWADGKWYYLGACEPAQELNQAWFSGPAQRAMLVVSTAYGDVESPQSLPANTDSPQSPPAIAGGVGGVASEPVLRRFGRSTLINSTAVYGPTKELTVKVVDKNGNPAPDVRVIFSLWNYGTLMPATSVVTDSSGTAKLVCGIGDWFISAVGQVSKPVADPMEDDVFFWITGVPKKLRTKIASWFKDDPKPFMAFAHVKGAETEVTLKLDATTPAKWPTELEYTPPVAPVAKAPEVISAEGIARGITYDDRVDRASQPDTLSKALADSLFRARLAWEDSLREANVWRTWQSFGYIAGQQLRQGERLADTTLWSKDSSNAEHYRKARGNWGVLFQFLHKQAPITGRGWVDNSDSRYSSELKPLLLDKLSEKDYRDVSLDFLWDHFVGSSIEHPLNTPSTVTFLNKLDSVSLDLYKDHVISPRIDYEPSLEWRQHLLEFITDKNYYVRESPQEGQPQRSIPERRPDLAISDNAILRFLRNDITIESSPDRLGPPLTPAQCLELRRGTESDIERLYIGLCRVRGIPARRNPVTGQVERWEESVQHASPPVSGNWVTVNVLGKKKEEKGKRKEEKASLTITVAEGDSLSASALYMKDWAVAKWEGNMADVMDFGWHEPFEKISWPQELPVGWYLISSGKRREDGSAAVKLKWVEVKTMTNVEW